MMERFQSNLRLWCWATALYGAGLVAVIACGVG